MLTEEQIKVNKTKFLAAARGYKICNEKLIEELEKTNFFLSPNATTITRYGAFPGGLINHLLDVVQNGLFINEKIDEKVRPSKESVIKVCLLHAIGKANLFIPNPSDWHRKTLGKMYDFNEELVSMTIGERSVYFYTSTGNTLKEDEYQAFINYDKCLTEDRSAEYHTEPLGEILKIAVKLTSINQKANKETWMI